MNTALRAEAGREAGETDACSPPFSPAPSRRHSFEDQVTPSRRNKRKMTEPKKRSDFSIKKICSKRILDTANLEPKDRPPDYNSRKRVKTCHAENNNNLTGIESETRESPHTILHHVTNHHDTSPQPSPTTSPNLHVAPTTLHPVALSMAAALSLREPRLIAYPIHPVPHFHPPPVGFIVPQLPLPVPVRPGSVDSLGHASSGGEAPVPIPTASAKTLTGLRGLSPAGSTGSTPESPSKPPSSSSSPDYSHTTYRQTTPRSSSVSNPSTPAPTGDGPTEEVTLPQGSGRRARKNYKNMTRERRVEANARERTRVHTISAAFESLRRAVPSYSYNQRLSKLAILRIACSYITALSRITEDDCSPETNRADGGPSFAECVDMCTRTIQAEGRAKRRH